MTRYKVLISGATGFVGSSLFRALSNSYDLYYFARCQSSQLPLPSFVPLDYNFYSLREFLGCNQVFAFIHLAGLAHNRKIDGGGPRRTHFLNSNVRLTRDLANLCALFGVHKFIYMSSVAVYGPVVPRHDPATPDSPLMPVTDYGISKLAAEHAILQVCSANKMSCIILRPPLVYSRDCSIGNLKILRTCISNGIPLPFAGIHNKRAFVSLDNVVSLIAYLLRCDLVDNGPLILLPSDPSHYSTPEFIKLFSRYAGLCDPIVIGGSWLVAEIFRARSPGLHFSLFGDFCVYDQFLTSIDWKPVCSLYSEC